MSQAAKQVCRRAAIEQKRLERLERLAGLPKTTNNTRPHLVESAGVPTGENRVSNSNVLDNLTLQLADLDSIYQKILERQPDTVICASFGLGLARFRAEFAAVFHSNWDDWRDATLKTLVLSGKVDEGLSPGHPGVPTGLSDEEWEMIQETRRFRALSPTEQARELAEQIKRSGVTP